MPDAIRAWSVPVFEADEDDVPVPGSRRVEARDASDAMYIAESLEGVLWIRDSPQVVDG